MKKNEFIYRIYKHTPKYEKHGKLTIEVTNKTSSSSDKIMITWQCDLSEGARPGWYACRSSWEHENYKLLPLLVKMEKAGIVWSSTFEEVINFLHNNNVEHALFINLRDNDFREIFAGKVSISEILKGKFHRYYNRKEFRILADQQKAIIEEIMASKDITVKQHLYQIA
jgi:hypothetical protein